MAAPARNTFKKKSSGSRIAALTVLALIIASVAGYFFLSSTPESVVPSKKSESVHLKPPVPPLPRPQAVPTLPPSMPSPRKEQQKYPSVLIIPKPEKSSQGEGSAARLAIIIDDMGSSMPEARSLAAIDVPLTFAIIPGLRVDKDVAAYATSQKIETMIHIPMQSKGWPTRRLEANGLLVAMDDGELQERVTGFVGRIPGAVGVNNHMGSEFTEQAEKMTAVLQILKKNNLFFVDSITSPESTGITIAKKLGIKSARRNVFLDNEQERRYILGQLDQAVRLAKKNGSAIAICHPHPVTISTLAAALPDLADQGVRLVPVSQLVK